MRRAAQLALALRGTAVAALALAWLGVSIERSRPAGGTCVVVAVDVSPSVGDGGRIAAARFLPAIAKALGPHDRLGLVAFAADAHVVAHPLADSLPPEALLAALDDVAAGRGETSLDRTETDLAGAVLAAGSLCPADRQGSVLLLTDGQETVGDVLAEAALFEAPTPVFTAAPTPEVLPAAVLRRLLVPRLTREGSSVPLEAVIESFRPAPVPASVELAVDGKDAGTRAVRLVPGVNVIALPYRPSGAGAHLIEVRLRLPPELPAAPGGLRAAVQTAPPPRIVVLTDRPFSVVAAALRERGLAVEIVRPSAVGSLADVHAVVLDDVPRAALPDDTIERLGRWTEDGGALVVTGGRRFFGDPGWRTGGLARLLPVELQPQGPEPTEREPVALVLVIDRSNSMGYASRPEPGGRGEKMEYARRAALAVLGQLGPRDLVAAIAFDSQPYRLAPLRPLGKQRETLTERLRALRPGGGTDFKAALEIARGELRLAPREVRHVILLTDGDTNRPGDDHEDVIAGLAADGITVTAIRIGTDAANLALLERIAVITGGAFHHVPDAAALPQLMIRDTRRVLDAPGRTTDAPARIGAPGTMLAGFDEREFPRVARWATTRLKPAGELRLWLDVGTRRDPLLATWQFGLGHVAVLPVDFQAGAASWAAWTGFGKLWAQILAWALPDSVAGEYRLVARPTPRGLVVRLDASGDATESFTLILADGREASLRRNGARSYEALLPELEPGPHAVVLRSGLREEELMLYVPAEAGSGREARSAGVNRLLLEALSARSGGSLDPAPASLLAARRGAVREHRSLETELAVAALLCFLVEVAILRLLLPGRR